MTFHTDEEAQARARYWQKLLRLQDWQLEVSIKRRSEMTGNSACGTCRIYVHSKYAIVTLLSPQDFQPGDAEDVTNMDDTLVHELLHLHMEPITPVGKIEKDSVLDIAVEQMIISVAGALAKLAKQADRVEPCTILP